MKTPVHCKVIAQDSGQTPQTGIEARKMLNATARSQAERILLSISTDLDMHLKFCSDFDSIADREGATVDPLQSIKIEYKIDEIIFLTSDIVSVWIALGEFEIAKNVIQEIGEKGQSLFRAIEELQRKYRHIFSPPKGSAKPDERTTYLRNHAQSIWFWRDERTLKSESEKIWVELLVAVATQKGVDEMVQLTLDPSPIGVDQERILELVASTLLFDGPANCVIDLAQRFPHLKRYASDAKASLGILKVQNLPLNEINTAFYWFGRGQDDLLGRDARRIIKQIKNLPREAQVPAMEGLLRYAFEGAHWGAAFEVGAALNPPLLDFSFETREAQMFLQSLERGLAEKELTAAISLNRIQSLKDKQLKSRALLLVAKAFPKRARALAKEMTDPIDKLEAVVTDPTSTEFERAKKWVPPTGAFRGVGLELRLRVKLIAARMAARRSQREEENQLLNEAYELANSEEAWGGSTGRNIMSDYNFDVMRVALDLGNFGVASRAVQKVGEEQEREEGVNLSRKAREEFIRVAVQRDQFKWIYETVLSHNTSFRYELFYFTLLEAARVGKFKELRDAFNSTIDFDLHRYHWISAVIRSATRDRAYHHVKNWMIDRMASGDPALLVRTLLDASADITSNEDRSWVEFYLETARVFAANISDPHQKGKSLLEIARMSVRKQSWGVAIKICEDIASLPQISEVATQMKIAVSLARLARISL